MDGVGDGVRGAWAWGGVLEGWGGVLRAGKVWEVGLVSVSFQPHFSGAGCTQCHAKPITSQAPKPYTTLPEPSLLLCVCVHVARHRNTMLMLAPCIMLLEGCVCVAVLGCMPPVNCYM